MSPNDVYLDASKDIKRMFMSEPSLSHIWDYIFSFRCARVVEFICILSCVRLGSVLTCFLEILSLVIRHAPKTEDSNSCLGGQSDVIFK